LALDSRREADHSPSSSAEVKEWVELYFHSPHTPSWSGVQLGGAQGQLYLYLNFYHAVVSIHLYFIPFESKHSPQHVFLKHSPSHGIT
jgi:hypothetical protein